MLMPKKVKFRKIKKGKLKGIETSANSISYGFFGIKSLTTGRVSAQQLESARKTMSRKMRKFGKIWLRVFPSVPVSGKPAEVRMGKGKGNINYWCFPVKAGRVIFEFQGVSDSVAFEINKLVNSKLPVLTKLIKLK